MIMNMSFDANFFRDEIREGFYIPTTIKQAWAAELMVLSEIDRICKEHHIQYFADWGTLLGVVRHGGFIPWDDDLDICMKREDYRRFRAVCDKELPPEYTIQDYERKENHRLFLTRVVNHSHYCFEEAHLKKYHNFPWLASVDIFIKDYLYRDESRERKRSEDILKILAVADGIADGKLRGDGARREIENLSKRYQRNFPDIFEKRKVQIALYRLAEERMAEVSEDEAEQIGQIFPWILKGKAGVSKEYYAETVRLPFENTTIPVNACYAKMLSLQFGDYLYIHKQWNGHGYPFYEAQKKNLEEVAREKLTGFAFSDFAFSKEMLQQSEADVMVPACANQRKEVLFLPIGSREWQAMDDIYREKRRDENTDVYVMPLPIFTKDIYGMTNLTEEELITAGQVEQYPEGLPIVNWWDFSLSQHHLDEVYIQWCYDGENPCLDIPQEYYAKNLRRYARQLILVPIGTMGEFEKSDAQDWHNMQQYVISPGVVYADSVFVQSDHMQKLYLQKLVDSAGRKTRKYWKDKIQVRETTKKQDMEESDGRKRLLFCIGVNEIFENSNDFVERVQERLSECDRRKEWLSLSIAIYPPKKEEWDRIHPILSKKLFTMLEGSGYKFQTVSRNNADKVAENYDAYYGSPSLMGAVFVSQNKPVMYADYEVTLEA